MTATRDALRPPAGNRPGNGGKAVPRFTMAFQPVVDLDRRRVAAYEALVRGPAGEGAASVLARVPEADRYAFDQACRTRAVALAAGLGLAAGLSVNVLPNALAGAETCIRATVRAARRRGFPPERLVFELTEGERVADVAAAARVIEECRAEGVRVALDDFGAGYAGLNLLADLHPDLVKLDRGLCRGIDASRPRRAIVHGVLSACRELGVGVVAEGVETAAELAALRDLGVRYVQGFLFARPAVERLPDVRWPGLADR